MILISHDDRTKPIDTINDRLRHARVMRGYRFATDFARKFDFEEGTYRSHENGQRGLSPEWLKIYADKLNISRDWLLTGEGDMNIGPGNNELGPYSSHIQRVPIINWIDAGQPGQIHPDSLAELETVPVISERPGLYGLKVRGSSMNNMAAPGDIIIFDVNDIDLIDRKLYVITFNEDQDATFKRYRSTDGRQWLEADSTEEHDPIFLDKPFRVVGRVVMILRET